MKKRWLLIASLVICAVVLLSACSPIDAKKIKESQRLDTVQVSRVEAVDGDYSCSGSDGLLATFRKVDDDGKATVKVLNIDTGAVIHTFTEEENKDLLLDNGFLVIMTNDEKTNITRSTIYDNAGQVVCENVKEYRFVNDCLVYDSVHVVRFDENTGAIKETYTHSEFDGSIPSCDEWTDDYYYDKSGRMIEVYDKHYVRTAAYTVPSYVKGVTSTDYVTYWAMHDGTIIVQGIVEVDAQSDRYDFLLEGTKYDLFTMRINPKNGKTQALSVDFVVIMLVRASEIGEDNIYDSSVKNLGVIVKIADKRLDMSESAMQLMSLDSRLKGNELFAVNGEAVSVEAIGNGYLIGEGAETGTTYLLNAKMKVLANMDAVRDHTEKYILTARGIYDYDLKQLEDLSDKDYRYMTTVGNALLFRETVTEEATETTPSTTKTTYYLYNGSFKKIADDETWEGNPNATYYVLRSTPDATEAEPYPETTYSYYDATGNLLFTSVGSTASVVASGENYCIMRVRTTDSYAYYRVQI